MTEILYIAAIDDEQAAIKSNIDDRVTIVPRKELYKFYDCCVGGNLSNRAYACLYCKSKNTWLYEYYWISSEKLLVWECNTDKYTELSARLTLPMCSIFVRRDKMIVANTNNACVTSIRCTEDDFTGMVFDSVAWDHKLFVHAQSFKTFGDGLYFIYNFVGVLMGSLAIRPIYETNLYSVRKLEKKYSLHAQAPMPDFDDCDLPLLQELKLFNLNKREDGVYLDDRKVFGG